MLPIPAPRKAKSLPIQPIQPIKTTGTLGWRGSFLASSGATSFIGMLWAETAGGVAALDVLRNRLVEVAVNTVIAAEECGPFVLGEGF
ncbi:hypothetical protein [Cyanobium sp. Cruz CV11-17]|uniref:hypothetical protein n=1 Tax=Cyanobium sp. Cruz CV11-17 TaxID=2823709 RepID=UPI0020CD4E02|nr:hypothetical protein [Cyanobium sp. Cruz CV11-17]